LGSRHIASSFLFHFRRQAASKITSRQASISIIVNKTAQSILWSVDNERVLLVQ
jgi:hypothetical protein